MARGDRRSLRFSLPRIPPALDAGAPPPPPVTRLPAPEAAGSAALPGGRRQPPASAASQTWAQKAVPAAGRALPTRRALLRWGSPAPRRGGSDVPGGGIEPVRGAPRRPWRLRAPRGGVRRGAAPGPGRAPLPARTHAGSRAGHGRLRTPSAQPKAIPAAAGLRAEPRAGRRLAPGPKMARPWPVGRRAHPVPPL